MQITFPEEDLLFGGPCEPIKAIVSSLFDAEVGFLDDLAPARDLRLDEFGELFGRVRHRLEFDLLKLFPGVGHRCDLDPFRVQAGDDVARRPRGARSRTTRSPHSSRCPPPWSSARRGETARAARSAPRAAEPCRPGSAELPPGCRSRPCRLHCSSGRSSPGSTPLYGTCVILIFARLLSSSPAR